MIQDTIRKYLIIENEIEKLNELLRKKREEYEKIGKEILHFCNEKQKGKIILPDGSNLKVCNNTSYQNLSYSMLERSLNEYNTRTSNDLNIKKIIDFIKLQRNSKKTSDIRHFKT